MDQFLILHRSIKRNDAGMFCCALFELYPILYVTNHHNYSRWMTYYSLELKHNRPEVMEALVKGAFSVNRSANPFARVHVGMALEQTINAQAKNRLKGIMRM